LKVSILYGSAIGFYALLLFAVERFYPLRAPTRQLLGRLTVNLTFAAIAFAVVSTLVRPAAEWTLGWSAADNFGLVRLMALPAWLQAVLAFILMDLTFYWWHRANHRIPLLWRFHNVHHFDPDLDLSTAFRFHFVELAFSAGFRILQVGLIGISAWTYVVYEVIFQAGTLFHHSNIRLPIHIERMLVAVFVTPRMHGIHHSQVPMETNSNYSTVFSFWDRLHRTLGLNIPQSSIQIGVPGYVAPDDNRLTKALIAPFYPQRNYWRRSDGSVPQRQDSEGGKGHLAQ
jgi:sterol desaturase/sphingolipid hydroxylase (fatty acid hydroxylase superfamily)